MGKEWDHTLHIKQFFVGLDALPAASETIARAKRVADAIRKFQSTLNEADDLYHDLDLCIEEFEELSVIENDYEARDRFNEALASLYDQADFRKRIWVK